MKKVGLPETQRFKWYDWAILAAVIIAGVCLLASCGDSGGRDSDTAYAAPPLPPIAPQGDAQGLTECETVSYALTDAQMVDRFRGAIINTVTLPINGRHVLTGDSLAWAWPTDKVNAGIYGAYTATIAAQVKAIALNNPLSIEIHVGINDLNAGNTCGAFINDMMLILSEIKSANPYLPVTVHSIFPVNEPMLWAKWPTFSGTNNQRVSTWNNALKNIVESNGYEFILYNNLLVDGAGQLDVLYTDDGLHLNDEGYRRIGGALNKGAS